MEHLPPTGWGDVATRRDLDILRSELRGAMSELQADFRGELNNAMTVQTRTMLFAMLGAILTLGGLMLAVARVS